MTTRLLSSVLLALVGAAGTLPAQVRSTRPTPERDDARRLARTVISRLDLDTDRPRLGIAVESRGLSDTLGLTVGDVTPGGPADKAGVKAGDRLVAINDVSLRIDSADAADPLMQGVATRRLTRELGRHESGDVVQLRVLRDGRPLTLPVTTAALADLQPDVQRIRIARTDADRASLGISLASTGSPRDTVGVFITSVAAGGPADKAGVQEGDRIASINGVDLRVPSADVEDWSVATARVRRLSRTLEQLKPGDDVTLRVIRAGQERTVSVKTVAARDLPRRRGTFVIGDGGMFSDFDWPPAPPVPPVPPVLSVPPVPPTPPAAPYYRTFERFHLAPDAPMSPVAPRPPLSPRWFYFLDGGDPSSRHSHPAITTRHFTAWT